MRFAVLADAHIGRSIPLAIAEHRRKAFSNAFTKAVDAIIEAGVRYVLPCGHLFQRPTLRPPPHPLSPDDVDRPARDTRPTPREDRKDPTTEGTPPR
ncbi:hypothetical protein H8D40_02960, partial [Candidatus Bathyarchaeota archaeon]|nr:hypothetical protein [Candidatus Bathyarchaeota archaeon]